MIDYSENGVTQKVIAAFLEVSTATISRFVNSKGFKPITNTTKKNLRYSIPDTRETIRSLYKGGLPKITKPVQAFYNFKGGTGKTSLSFQVSTHLALMGYRVLVVDCDPQGHLSASFGLLNDRYLTLYDVISKNVSVNECIKEVFDGLDCIPANLALTRIDIALNQLPKREERLKLILAPLRGEYDFIIIDTNPTISIMNRNVISATDRINIICETQPYSINGLNLLLEDTKSFFKAMQMEGCDIGIVPNKYEDRMATSQEAMGLLNRFYKEMLIQDFAVRKSEDMNVAAKNSLPLAFFCKANSNAMEDVIRLIKELLVFSSSSVYIEDAA